MQKKLSITLLLKIDVLDTLAPSRHRNAQIGIYPFVSTQKKVKAVIVFPVKKFLRGIVLQFKQISTSRKAFRQIDSCDFLACVPVIYQENCLLTVVGSVDEP